MQLKTRTIEDDNGNETEIQVPCKWIICGYCQGNGKHSRDLGAITSSEWADEWDEESRENYLSGAYDKSCEECHGSGKVLEEDYSTLSKIDRELLEAQDQSEADYQRTCAAERRMGY